MLKTPALLVVPRIIHGISQGRAGSKLGPICTIRSGSLAHIASWSLKGASWSRSRWCSCPIISWYRNIGRAGLTGPCWERCSVCGGVAVCSLSVSWSWSLPWYSWSKTNRCRPQTTSSRSHAWSSPDSWPSPTIIIRVEGHVWSVTAGWAGPGSWPWLGAWC